MSSPEAQGLPGCRLFLSSDLDETRERISAVMQPHQLRPESRCNSKFYMDYLRMPELGIGTIYFGHMSVRVDAIRDYHLVMFCRSGAGIVQTSLGEVTVDAAHGICLAPGEPLIGEFSADCEQLVLRIDDRLLCRMAGEERPRLPVTLRSDRDQIKPWLSTVSMLLGDRHYVSLLQGNPAASRAYQQVCVAMLLAGVTDSGSKDPDPLQVRGCVLRAQAHIREMFAAPLALSDIADAACVSVRTLLHCFKNSGGGTPMQYLRECRLKAARARLLNAGCDTATVARVAFEVGLSHLGRFSMAYRKRFGEYPSQTLSAHARPARQSLGRTES